MDVLQELEKRGAVLTDMHFVYKSGKHGPHYINMDPVFPETDLMRELGWSLGAPFLESGIDVVVGAATGGIPLGVYTALRLGNGAEYPYPATAWADKVGDGFAFARAGFPEVLRSKNVIVVEDLLNTGDSVKKVIAQVRKHDGNVIGVSVICNRGSETTESLDVPRLEQLSRVDDFQVLEAATCSLCRAKVPIVLDIGHGAKFREDHPSFDIEYVSLLG